MDINSKVLIIDGEYKGIKGIIVDIYEGWNFAIYTVLNEENKYDVYHDQVQELE